MIDLEILLTSSVLLAVLISTHSVFGVEVVKRGIIFTDLAIGQMASVGVAFAMLFNLNTTLFGLLFAVITGLLISLTEHKQHREVFIALLYAFGISLINYILYFAPHGNESLLKLMARDILFFSINDVIKSSFLYLIIIAIWLISKDRINKRWRDILFFLLFGIVVSISVKIAGVFVVFAILIAPPILALNLLKSDRIIHSLIIGLPIGILAILIALIFDISVGYSIIGLFSLFGILSFIKL